MINWRIRRARDLKGRYKGDDESTAFNEAWIAGRAPKKNWIKRFLDWWFKDFNGR